jgi:glutaredoxin-related protein
MKQVDELIRGEMAAVRSIDTVLEKIQDVNEKTHLSTFRQDHLYAIDVLKRFADSDIEEDTQSAGPWGGFAQTFVSGASLFGDKAAVKALKVGEEHGIKEYQEALEDDSINMELKEVIRAELIPNQQRHINAIERFVH